MWQYRPYSGDFPPRTRGNLLSHEEGTANAYGLEKAQVRGTLFAKPGDPVYDDQIIGIHSSAGDLKVNVCKAKQLTNHRAAMKDDATVLYPPKLMTLEDAVEYVIDGEYVEITPQAVRMGKEKTQKAR